MWFLYYSSYTHINDSLFREYYTHCHIAKYTYQYNTNGEHDQSKMCINLCFYRCDLRSNFVLNKISNEESMISYCLYHQRTSS